MVQGPAALVTHSLQKLRRYAVSVAAMPDLVRFQTTGLTSVGSLSRPAQIGIGRYACTAPFPFFTKNLGLRLNDQSCHHETWLRLDFVDWRNSQSHHEELDRRIPLKERPSPHHQGVEKRRISDTMSDHSLSS